MALLAYEGIVEHGRIQLRDDVILPEHTIVFVVIPGFEPVSAVQIQSPRLAHPEQAADFAKQVIKITPNAEL